MAGKSSRPLFRGITCIASGNYRCPLQASENSLYCTKLFQISADAVTVYFFRQAFLQGIEAFHKVFVLLARKLPGLLLIARPLEPVPGSQFLVQKKVAVAFKEESLDPVAPTSAEKEQCPFLKRVQPELVLDHESEGVDPQHISVYPVTTITRFAPAPSLSMVQHQADPVEQGL